MSTKSDLTGKFFGQWEVLERLPPDKALCRCSCGKESVVYVTNLKSGRSTSCGCNKALKISLAIQAHWQKRRREK